MSDEPINPMLTLGTSGLRQFAGYIDEEFNQMLRGRNGLLFYREMADNSSATGAVRYIIKALTRGVDWKVEAASLTEQAQEQAAFVESCLGDMEHTFESFISEVLSFIEYGFSPFELVFKIRRGPDETDDRLRSNYDDGKWGIRNLGIRAQDTVDHWHFDADGRLLGMFQLDTYANKGLVYIPREKLALFRTESNKGNPEGRSLYRNAAIDYYYLKRFQEIEAVGVERDLTGLPVMEVPPDLLRVHAKPEDAALRVALEQMLGSMKRNAREYAMIPSSRDREDKPTGFKLSLLSTGGKRQIDTTEIKNYYRRSILQTVAAGFIELGMQATGSFALASSQTNLFAVALGALLDEIVATFNAEVIKPLMQLNKVAPEFYPKLTHGDIEDAPLLELGQYLTALAAAQLITPSPALEDNLRQRAGLPKATDTSVTQAGQAPADMSQAGTTPTIDPETGKPLPVVPVVAPQPTDATEVDPAVERAQQIGQGDSLNAVSLNGAQVAALLQILAAVAEQKLPRDSGVAAMTAAFPITQTQADAIMGSIGKGFVAADAKQPEAHNVETPTVTA